jgi:hypothetical protein
MEKYKEQRENLMASANSQSALKHVENCEHFLAVNKSLIVTIVEETYTEQFLCGHKLSNRLWKAVTGKLDVVFGLLCLCKLLRNPFRLYFTTKLVIPRWNLGQSVIFSNPNIFCLQE